MKADKKIFQNLYLRLSPPGGFSPEADFGEPAVLRGGRNSEYRSITIWPRNGQHTRWWVALTAFVSLTYHVPTVQAESWASWRPSVHAPESFRHGKAS